MLEKTKNRVKLYIKGVPLHVLNSIRRSILAEVPTMAIDYVVFTVNSSVFYDEYIAHRLGLIPLTSDEALEKYKSPEECREAGEKGIFSEDCFVKFELEGKGEPDKVVILYSGDLKTSDPSVKPVYDKIPIVALARNQEIRLEAYARLGRGKEHAKWSPASVAAHKYVADIIIDYNKCEGADCSKCVEACPRNVLGISDGKVIVVNDKILDCTLCKACEEICPAKAIKIGWRENEYILTVESTGALSISKILVQAVKELENKLDAFVKYLRQEGVLD